MALRSPPPGLVDLAAHVPGLALDVRYHTADNFTGAPLPGYGAPGAWAIPVVADAMVRAQASLKPHGYRLVVFDAYRPVRATRAMVDWIRATGNDWMLDGWISATSRHNRGIAVDVGLVHADGAPADLGSEFDAFSDASHTLNGTGAALVRRLLLRDVMLAHGFDDYRREWWHFEWIGPEAAAATPLDAPYGDDETI